VCNRSHTLVEGVDTEHAVCPIEQLNSLSSMSETNSSMDGKSGEQKPRRTPRRMKAAIRCRSEDDAHPPPGVAGV